MNRNNQVWVAARFPNGSWSSGGQASSPDYEKCEVYLISASSHGDAVKRAQGIRSRLKRKGTPFPSQAEPYVEKF